MNPSSKYKIIELNSPLYLQWLVQEINGYLSNGHEVWLDPFCATNTAPLRVAGLIRRDDNGGDMVCKGENGATYYLPGGEGSSCLS